jgi:hypothetical protein
VDIAISGAAGPTAGREVEKITGHGQATILVVARVGYLRGSAGALTVLFNLPAADARKWIAFYPGDPGYQDVEPGVTIDSFLSGTMPVGPFTKTVTRLHGQRVIALRGKVAPGAGVPAGSKETVYITVTGRPLPVAISENISAQAITGVFSGWGQARSVTKPPHAVRLPAGSGSASA